MQRHLLSLFSACSSPYKHRIYSSSDKSGIAIPKDASFALHVNIRSLTSKVSW